MRASQADSPWVSILSRALGWTLVIVIATILLCDDYYAPTHILVVAGLPIFLVLLLLRFRLRSFHSIILISAIAYLASLVLATFAHGGFPDSDILPLLLPLSLTAAFLAAFCLLTRTHDGFPVLLCDWATFACAANAVVSTVMFFRQDMSWGVIANFRLIPYLGVPAYQGSTTIGDTYAIYFVYGFSVLVASRRPRWQRLALGLAASVLLLGLVATQGRGAYMAALAGVVVVSVASSRRNRLIAAALLGTAAVAALYPPFTAALLYRGAGYRVGIWLSYLEMAAAHPFTGYGMLADTHRMVEGHLFNHAHDVVLAAEIRGGLIGLASMLVMLGTAVDWSVIHLRRTGDPALLGIVVTLIVGWILNHELLVTYPDWTWVTFWVPVGLVAGAEARLRGGTWESPGGSATGNGVGSIRG